MGQALSRSRTRRSRKSKSKQTSSTPPEEVHIAVEPASEEGSQADEEPVTEESPDDEHVLGFGERAEHVRGLVPESTPVYAGLALALTMQDWTELGFGNDPMVAASDDFEVTVERLTALMLVRIVAVACAPTSNYQDLSTATICRSHLLGVKEWPEPITDEIIVQLRELIRRFLGGYQDTPYHNWEHAYHVTISVNKLLDLMLNVQHVPKYRRPPTFGLRFDPLMHMAMIFSAIIHDVEHRGIGNRQLSIEKDPIAILYNDQSVLEMRSLYIGFHELLKDEFTELRAAMFSDDDEYQRFRKVVVNIILTTDIASAERTQLNKSKWKEAFGDTFETIERKVRKEIARRGSAGADPKHTGSLSALDKDMGKFNRRGTAGSMFSELTMDHESASEVFGKHNEEDSGSATPESSESYGYEDDQDGVIMSGVTMSKKAAGGATTPLSNRSVRSESSSKQDDSVVSEVISEVLSKQLRHNSIGQSVASKSIPEEKTVDSNRSSGLSSSKRSSEDTDEDDTERLDESSKKKNLESEARVGPGTNEMATGRKNGQGGKNTKEKNATNPIDDSVSQQDQSVGHNSMGYSEQSTGVRKVQHKHEAEDNNAGFLPANLNPVQKFQRRFSSSSQASTKQFRQRLGIRRSMDLSGETIDHYRASQSGATVAHTGAGEEVELNDEPDELKATVVMETIIKAADVAHNLQGWYHMEKWSNRLYLELKKANVQGRGFDPKGGWFGGQIGFLESVLLPLARQMEDMGVFGDEVGPVFAQIVESNRDRWLRDGQFICDAIIEVGENMFEKDEEGQLKED